MAGNRSPKYHKREKSCRVAKRCTAGVFLGLNEVDAPCRTVSREEMEQETFQRLLCPPPPPSYPPSRKGRKKRNLYQPPYIPPLPGSEETDVRVSDTGANRAWAPLQMQPWSIWSTSLSELLCEERGDPQRRALCVGGVGVDRRGRELKEWTAMDLHPPCSALSALGTSRVFW